jgi:ribosomal protein L30/L7E
MASRDTVSMLGLKALHVQVAKPTVPQYGVTLGSKGNLR